MAYTYENRKGVVYTLCEVERKRGSRYVFARAPKGRGLDEIPSGYEVKESVNGIVSLRKERTTALKPLEVELVRGAVERQLGHPGYGIDADGDRITVYQAAIDFDEFENLRVPRKLIEAAIARRSLSPVLRFTLVDSEERIFMAERWCYRGSIDGWIHLQGSGRLPDIVKCLVPHLGRESFYELL